MRHQIRSNHVFLLPKTLQFFLVTHKDVYLCVDGTSSMPSFAKPGTFKFSSICLFPYLLVVWVGAKVIFKFSSYFSSLCLFSYLLVVWIRAKDIFKLSSFFSSLCLCPYLLVVWIRTKVIFGLNALSGRSIKSNGEAIGAWNYTNAESFIRFTAENNYTIDGWELGKSLYNITKNA